MNVPPGFVLTAGPGWIALDKPAGMSVHNEPGDDALAVAKFCLDSDDELKLVAKPDGSPLSPVHRLDRETSGVLLVATSRASASKLQTAFAERAHKLYRAIVRGRIERDGKWTQPLTDKAESRDNPAGKSGERKECETLYRVVRSNPHLTELEVDLVTGRQHQIRKHAALAKHALVGDRRYADAKHTKMIEERFGIARMLLHAHRLDLDDLKIEAPVPPEFESVFAKEER